MHLEDKEKKGLILDVYNFYYQNCDTIEILVTEIMHI